MITIITVCYNAADELEKTINSVLTQSRHDIQYIIKDGFSTDETDALIKRYRSALESKFSSFFYVSGKDSGIYDAMNQAAKMATGDWLLFLNAGDELFGSKVIESLTEPLTLSKADVVYGNAALRKGDRYRIVRPSSEIQDLEKGMSFCHQAAFIKTDLMKALGYDTQYRISADYDFFVRAYKMNKRFEYLDLTIAYYLLGGVSYQRPFDLRIEAYKIKLASRILDQGQSDRGIKTNKRLKMIWKCIPGPMLRSIQRYKHKHDTDDWETVAKD